jgi:integrase
MDAELDTTRGSGAPRLLRQRRALATELRVDAFARVTQVRRLARALLKPIAAGPAEVRETAAVVGAVLGTIVWSGVTGPFVWQALARLRQDQLDLSIGVLVLEAGEPDGSSRPGTGRTLRVPLHPFSVLQWGRLQLIHRGRDEARDRDVRVLPSHWRTPDRLRLAVYQIVRDAGLGPWALFLRTVRIFHLLGPLAPIGIARRAGRVIAVSVGAAEWRQSGWLVSDRLTAQQKTTGGALDSSSAGVRRPPPLSWRLACRKILAGLRGETDRNTRRRMADELERLPEDEHWLADLPVIGKVVCGWAVALLRSRRIRPNTVRTWLGRIGHAIDYGVLTDALFEATSPAEVIAVVREILVSSEGTESRRSMRTALRQFLAFAATRGYAVPNVTWGHPELAIRHGDHVVSLLSPREIRNVVNRLRDQSSHGLALAVAVALGGLGGLRRSEVCRLTVADVPRDRRWTVRVRRSKTAAGRRFVPLGRLAPVWALELLEAYVIAQGGSASPDSPFLVTTEGTPWDPDVLGERVTQVLRQVSGKPATFHWLRRACATWWMVRWASDILGVTPPYALDGDGPPPDGVRAVLGEDRVRVLWSLARLLGHASPYISVVRYVACVDWIEAQLLGKAWQERLPRRLVAGLLDVSERWTRAIVRTGPGQTPARAVLDAQLRRLTLLRAFPVPGARGGALE